MKEHNAPLSARLSYLQLGSADPGQLARFYAQVFGMRVQEIDAGWVCSGPDRCLVLSEGSSNSLLSAGYAVADASILTNLAERAGAHLVDTTALDSYLFAPGAISLRDPDGNRVVYGIPAIQAGVEHPKAPPARLQHVVVGSTDIERMVAFYTDVVGLHKSDEVRDEHEVMRTCFMRTDHEHHSFAVFTTSSNRLDHHCYELPDWNCIRDWGDRLAAHQIPVKWGPGRHGPGNNLFLFFHDPDGNWVELSTELELVDAQRPVGIWPHEERTLNSWGRGHLRS